MSAGQSTHSFISSKAKGLASVINVVVNSGGTVLAFFPLILTCFLLGLLIKKSQVEGNLLENSILFIY